MNLREISSADLSGVFDGVPSAHASGGASGPQGEGPSVLMPPPDAAEPEAVAEEVVETTEETQEAAKPEVKPPEPKKESEIQKINRQIAANNRIQRNLQQRQAEIAQAEAKLAEQQKAMAEIESFRTDMKSKGLLEVVKNAAEIKGMTVLDAYRELIANMAGVYEEPEAAKVPELDPRVKAEIDAARKETADLKAQLADKETREAQSMMEANVDAYGDDAMATVTEESYPLLAAKARLNKAAVREQFLALADKYSEKTGEVVEPDELLAYMEELHMEEAESLSTALTKKKGNAKPTTEAQASTPPEKGAGSPDTSKRAESKPTALTNDTAASRSGSISSGRRTERERRQAAIEYLKTRV